MTELCEYVQEFVQLERNKLMARLQEQSHTIHEKLRKATTIPFKREYQTYEKQAIQLLQQVEAMTDQEFITYLSTNASSDYMKIEHRVHDIDTRHLERLRQANEKRRMYRESLNREQ